MKGSTLLIAAGLSVVGYLFYRSVSGEKTVTLKGGTPPTLEMKVGEIVKAAGVGTGQEVVAGDPSILQKMATDTFKAVGKGSVALMTNEGGEMRMALVSVS